MALTRAEKRERKAMLELRRDFQLPKRAGSSSSSNSKAGRRLPGGAVDATSDASGSGGAGSAQLSARARLTMMPNTLTKLNVNKRDTRTIDEILQDRAKLRGEVKVLDGEDAREFNDWFGGKKKREPVNSAPTSKPASPAPGASSSATSET
jgi:protein SPT2